MRRILLLTTCSLALFSASCGEKKSVDSQQEAPISAQAQPSPQPAAHGAAPQNVAGKSDAPVPPRDAQFTLVCKELTGPGHVEQSKKLKDELIKGTALKNWYVSHDDQKSTLYYGYYASMDDARLKADRERIVMMQDQIGNRPFAGALPVSIDSPDPTAPPEFNLVNAKGYWSLQIAAYKGPGRKEAAVEAVREARKMGIEAYYHHGPNVSEVCVGTWPEEAIRKQESDGGDGIDATDQQRPLLFLGPGAEIPPALKEEYSKNLIDKETGRQVQMVEQKVEVTDPTLRAAMAKYPTHSVNGFDDVEQMRDPATGKMVSYARPSVVVPIPHGTSILQADQDTPQPGLIYPQSTPPPGGAQLRSIGQ